MITVTANSYHEKLHIQDEEIILNGPPSSLSGQITISNREDETLFIRDLPVSDAGSERQMQMKSQHFRLLTSLKGGEEKVLRVKQQVAPSTPPGEYESSIRVGGVEKRIKMIVQPKIKVNIYPLNLNYSGVQGHSAYESQLTFSNTGNMSFKIPEIKHANAFDEDFLCRATSLAIREKGNEGYIATMDQLTKNVHKEMAGWAQIHLEESGRIVEPGETIQLHFKLTLPENVDPSRDYFGSVRIWKKVISYHVKSH